MSGEPAFKFDVRGDFGFTLDVPGGVLSPERVSRFLNYLILEEARERSELTPEDAAEIAHDVDQAIWEQVRHEYEEA